MGSFNMEATQINYRRDETIKTVDQKLQELSQESAIDTDIAPVFKSTSSYSAGDLVYYRNKLYTCTTPHSGAWAAADFTATDVTTAIKSAAAVKADEADIASAFDATATYDVGDLVYYGGTIYRCTNAHEGDWDADDFSATTISEELNAINSNLSTFKHIMGADSVTNAYEGDVNNLTETGAYWCSNATNLPSTQWYIVLVFAPYVDNNGRIPMQIAICYTAANVGATYTRIKAAAGWSAWSRLNPT